MPARRALIISENAPVPSDRRVWNEACALRDAGWDVTIVCAMGETRHRAQHERLDGVAIHRYPLQAAAGGLLGYAREYGQALWRIRRLVRRLAREQGRFDVVHACNPPDFLLLAARSLRRRDGTAMVFDHHDLVPELYRAKFGEGRSPMHVVARALERVAFRMADVVICTNASYAAVATGRGGRSPEDVFIVRNGPDLARFTPVAPDPAWKRGKELLVGYLGIMGAQDGVDHALRALAWLAPRRDDWHAVLIGDGDELSALQALAGELGIADRVTFAGWRLDDDIRSILSTCDVALAPDPPSPLNSFSTMIKIPEYMAMGCPVISYDLHESRVSAGSDAAVFARAGDSAALGAALDEVLGDAAQRAAMAAAGLTEVRDRLAWQHQLPALLAAYERAVGGGSAPHAPRVVSAAQQSI
jgi:glycosyltransferase involved in cell wall biosynthesis